MPILSIQSSVVYGHVGNSVAALPLMRLGHEVWRLDTVAFSNHPGHGGFSGRVVPPAEIAELLRGLKALGVLADCRAVLSGYLGEAGTAAVVADAVSSAKSANPKAIYLLDPVIGDGGRVFVRPGVPEAIVARLNHEIATVLNVAETRERLAGVGLEVVASSATQLAAMIPVEVRKWGDAVKRSGARVD